MPNRTPVRSMLVAALATALAVGGCSRALSTAPATPSNAGPATSLLAKRGAQPASAARILGPVVAAVQRIVSDPLFVLDPGAPVVTGALEFLPLVDQLVQPGTEATVKGGRWTLQFHAGSLSAATPVSVSEASDGTMRVQFGPDGTQFGTAIDLTIDYSGTSLDPTSPNELYLGDRRLVRDWM